MYDFGRTGKLRMLWKMFQKDQPASVVYSHSFGHYRVGWGSVWTRQTSAKMQI